MDRQMTGLWTQRSPLRDAAVPYLQAKFYSAGRFDSLIDGLNRELSARLTGVRRPGSSVFNANSFPPANSFYSYKSIQNGAEVVRTMYDGTDGTVYDATPGQKSTIFTKSAGAGPMRFLGVNTTLFMANGVDQKKWLYNAPWQALTSVSPGTLISASNGTVQMALGGITMNIIATSATSSLVTLYIDPSTIPAQFPNLSSNFTGVRLTFSGLTSATYLNGSTHYVNAPGGILSTTLGILQIALTGVTPYAYTVDTGSCTTGTGVTGPTVPAFSSSEFRITIDSNQQWKCYGPWVQNTGLAVPMKAPTLTPLNGTRYWQPLATISFLYAILDPSGNVEIAINYTAGSGGVYKTGQSYPTWKGYNYSALAEVVDGSVIWANYGPIGAWAASTTFGSATQPYVILDSNQNLQWLSSSSGATGGTQPTWATAIGTHTTDGGATWTCLGPGVAITTNSVQYAFSYHAVDASVSTASPVARIQGGILGVAQRQNLPYIAVSGALLNDTQYDQAWIWRTAQGQASLLLEDQIPTDALTGSFTYNDYGVPDTSTNGNGSLIAQIGAPIAESNNPPPASMTAPVYHLQRQWAIVGNTVVYSGGPDTLTGNGLTAFPPLNSIAYPEQPIRLMPFTVSNGGLLVITTSNVYVILGTGTASNPFYTTIYMPSVGILGYNALDVVGSTFYMMTGKRKFISLDPSAGYVEQGFPIGDQFTKVTTGGISAALYNPATAYVSWCEQSSGDTAIYVADGAAGWFRFSPVSSPESGYVWSPRAAIQGGTSAVQAVETSPGQSQLLIAPAAGTTGPILFRDSSVNADWTGTAYSSFASYLTFGNIVLCETGEVAEVAHVGIQSVALGARPLVSVLFDELAPTLATPFDLLQITSSEPPDLAPSTTMYSDRYSALQNGVCPRCLSFQMKIDYGTQNVADETLKFAIYGAKWAERIQR
jgi:hypothetical protein